MSIRMHGDHMHHGADHQQIDEGHVRHVPPGEQALPGREQCHACAQREGTRRSAGRPCARAHSACAASSPRCVPRRPACAAPRRGRSGPCASAARAARRPPCSTSAPVAMRRSTARRSNSRHCSTTLGAKRRRALVVFSWSSCARIWPSVSFSPFRLRCSRRKRKRPITPLSATITIEKKAHRGVHRPEFEVGVQQDQHRPRHAPGSCAPRTSPWPRPSGA